MPYGGNDWLALTQEPTLEPELPICDPHHHFWDFRTERIPGFDHGVGHPLLLLCNAKAPNYRKNKAFKDLAYL